MDNIKNAKGIIFDFDGTLYDLAFIGPRLILGSPLNFPYIIKERTVRKFFEGKDCVNAEGYYDSFFKRLGKTSPKPPEFWRNWFFGFYMPHMIKILKKYYKPRKDTQILIQSLIESGRKVAVYSDYPMLKERMEAIGLAIHEELRLYGLDSFGAQKPAVRPFLQIAGDFGLHPKEILVAGDRKDRDGIAAIGAKMSFFHVKNNNWNSLLSALLENH